MTGCAIKSKREMEPEWQKHLVLQPDCLVYRRMERDSAARSSSLLQHFPPEIFPILCSLSFQGAPPWKLIWKHFRPESDFSGAFSSQASICSFLPLDSRGGFCASHWAVIVCWITWYSHFFPVGTLNQDFGIFLLSLYCWPLMRNTGFEVTKDRLLS